MMRVIAAGALLLAWSVAVVSIAQMPESFICETSDISHTVCYDTKCTTAITDHIKLELDAAFSYMYIAALFDDDMRAYPGLAKMLYEAGSEERQHAIMMMEYLNKRGIMYRSNYTFIANDHEEVAEKDLCDKKDKELTSSQLLMCQLNAITSNPAYADALEVALKMEIMVTMKIHEVIQQCHNDYDGADFFTEPILEEQHDGIRKIQRAIKDLKNLKLGPSVGYGSDAFAEFLFDKKLLENGL